MLVLDASALLALFNQEAGWQRLAGAIVDDDSTISAVNYAEVLQKAARIGVPAETIDAQLDELGVTVRVRAAGRSPSGIALPAPIGPQPR